MTFERAAELATEFRETEFSDSWAREVANAGDDPQNMADAFYAGPPGSKGDAFDVMDRWLEKNYPDEADFSQEILMDLSSAVAGELLAGVDDGLEVAVELAPEEDVETLAEAVGCKRFSLRGKVTRMKFTEVRQAREAFSCLCQIGYFPRPSRRLGHTLRRG